MQGQFLNLRVLSTCTMLEDIDTVLVEYSMHSWVGRLLADSLAFLGLNASTVGLGETFVSLGPTILPWAGSVPRRNRVGSSRSTQTWPDFMQHPCPLKRRCNLTKSIGGTARCCRSDGSEHNPPTSSSQLRPMTFHQSINHATRRCQSLVNGSFLAVKLQLGAFSRPDYPYQLLSCTLLRGTLGSLLFPMGEKWCVCMGKGPKGGVRSSGPSTSR